MRTPNRVHGIPNKKRKRKQYDILDDDFVSVQESKKRKIHTTIALALALLLLTIIGACVDVTNRLTGRKATVAQLEAAKKRKPKLRTTWAKEKNRISPTMHYRLFRMFPGCFNNLCDDIKKHVGEKEFKSESYINQLKLEGKKTKRGSMYLAHVKKNGDYIPGEVKVAMTLRILAGASYLDMFLWFNVHPDYVRYLTRKVMREWFCSDAVSKINFYHFLKDDEQLQKVRSDFGTKSNGILGGCIGAIDGWVVKIRRPTWWEVVNPGKYYSRKGFYGLNVQAIVDKKKRVLWRAIGQKGSSHDSKVFNESQLGQYLLSIGDDLLAKGLYIVGDSAYALRSYLLAPYDNATPGSKEDTFNYYLSSNRIYVECAFGEIDRRWGIFWRPLEGALENHQYTIDSAIRLHNYIVNYRENMKENDGNGAGRMGTSLNIRSEEDELNHASDNFLMVNPSSTLGPIYDTPEEECRARGCPTKDATLERDKGKLVRDKLCNELHREGFARPSNRNVSVKDRHNRVIAAT